MPSLRHLYNCRVGLLRLSGTMAAGTPVLAWSRVTGILDPALGIDGELMCRLDLGFVRPGRDQPMAVVAGRAPDRIGVMFYDTAVTAVKAGDRVVVLAGPVTGNFEIRAVPDPANDMSTAHHMEVQVIEVALSQDTVFPSGTPGQDSMGVPGEFP
jgi:hypothetical protein